MVVAVAPEEGVAGMARGWLAKHGPQISQCRQSSFQATQSNIRSFIFLQRKFLLNSCLSRWMEFYRRIWLEVLLYGLCIGRQMRHATGVKKVVDSPNNMTCLVFMYTSHNQVFGPLHVLGGKASAASRQLRTKVRHLPGK